MRAAVARPCAVRGPAIALLGFGGLLGILARTTGSGWLIVIAAGVVPLVVLGAIAPAVPLLRARPAVGLPADGTVGRSLPMVIAVAARARGLELHVRDPASAWIRVDGPASGTVRAVPARRGVIASVTVELRSSAPFGLVAWRRTIVVRCGRVLEVGPVPAWGEARHHGADGADGAERVASSREGDTVRGIRPYTAGDSYRRVHWPATARWGDVMVREVEQHAPPRLVLVVDLRGGSARVATTGPRARRRATHSAEADELVEAVAARAAGLVRDALAAGRAVLLGTAQPTGPVVGPVTSEVGASRRLARAVPGAPGIPRSLEGDVVVQLAVQP